MVQVLYMLGDDNLIYIYANAIISYLISLNVFDGVQKHEQIERQSVIS